MVPVERRTTPAGGSSGLGRRWLLWLAGLALAAFAAWQLVPGEAAYRAAMGVERWHSGLTLEEVVVGGRPVPYLIGGEGEPLVLLHGFTGDKDNWTRVAGHLTGHFRVVVPDLPGFGDSAWDPDGDPSDYSVPAQAGWLATFLDGTKLERVWLGGNSMGGNIAGVFAATYPDRVAGLWLLAPLGVSGAPYSELDERVAAGLPVPLLPTSGDNIDETIAFLFEEPPWLPRAVKRYLGERLVARRDRYLDIRAQIRSDGPDGYPRASSPIPAFPAGVMPALVVWGDRDRVLAPGGAAMLARDLPDARVVIMPGVGHVPMMERPAETAAALLAFKRELDAG